MESLICFIRTLQGEKRQMQEKDFNWKDLSNLDDLTKFLIIDQCVASVKKYKIRHIPFFNNVQSELKHIAEKFITNGNSEQTVDSLVKVCTKYHLFSLFSIRDKSWLNMYLQSYVDLLQTNSKVQLKVCNRYSLDDHKGIAIIAREDIEVKTKLTCLFGIHLSLTKNEASALESDRNDFSIMSVPGSRKPNIMLGSLAFLNHDCNFNCTYVVHVENLLTVKVIKKIKKGEEIFVNYGEHYFDVDNQNCECDTCRQKKIVSYK